MIKDIHQTEVERKLHSANEGYERLPPEVTHFAFPERVLVRDEVVARLQKGLDLFTEVRSMRAAYQAAVEAHRKALPELKQLHADAIQVARHFGSDAKVMETFGGRSPANSKRRQRQRECERGEAVVTEVIEEVIVDCEPERRGTREPERGTEPHQRRGEGKRCRRGR